MWHEIFSFKKFIKKKYFNLIQRVKFSNSAGGLVIEHSIGSCQSGLHRWNENVLWLHRQCLTAR